MAKLNLLFLVFIFFPTGGLLNAQNIQVSKTTYHLTVGGGLATSYNEYYSKGNARTVGATAAASINVATRPNLMMGIEFDGYIGYNLNIIIPLTIYLDKKDYIKLGPSGCRVGYDFANRKYGFGFAVGAGADFDTGFLGDAEFESILVNANFIIQRVEGRSTNYFSLTAGIRFSSGI